MAIKIQGNTVIDDSQNWAGSTIPVDKGGTGATTLSGVLIGNGTGPVTTKTNPTGDFVGTTDTQTLTNKTLTTPVLSATASGTIAGSLGYSSGNLNYGTGSAQRTVVNTNAAQTLTNKTINGNNNTITNISLSTAVTGTLPVGNGGTGATTLSGILIGNGVASHN